MNALENVKNSLTRVAGKIKFTANKHAPEILLVTGIIGVIGGAVAACKATLNAQDTLAEHNEQLEKIDRYSGDDDEKKKETAKLYLRTGVKLAKTYAPAVAIEAAGITCILAGHKIIKNRNALLATACATTEKAFSEYRERVADRFGSEIENQIRLGLKPDESETIAETNPETGESENVILVNKDTNIQLDRFDRIFDESNVLYEKNAIMNKSLLYAIQTAVQNRVRNNGFITMAEVYEKLAYPTTDVNGKPIKELLNYGWVDGDTVDFGFMNLAFTDSNFINGNERSVLLRFNCHPLYA